MSFGVGPECVGKRSPNGEGGGIEDQRVSARGGCHSSPGCPKGASTSHGTRAFYDRPGCFDQGGPAGAAELPSQGVRPGVSAAAVEPARLGFQQILACCVPGGAVRSWFCASF